MYVISCENYKHLLLVAVPQAHYYISHNDFVYYPRLSFGIDGNLTAPHVAYPPGNRAGNSNRTRAQYESAAASPSATNMANSTAPYGSYIDTESEP